VCRSTTQGHPQDGSRKNRGAENREDGYTATPRRTSVTDAGLAYLQRLSQLKKLDLTAT
jgi:hypothetical protein